MRAFFSDYEESQTGPPKKFYRTPEMEECRARCREAASLFLKHTFMDMILGRSLEEKIENHCHVECVMLLGCKNFKRNGRWGFKMMFGISELFSSLFACLSLVSSIYCVNKHVFPQVKRAPHRTLLYAQYYICNFAFLSSMVFHMRETTLTRYADYFSAYLNIMIGFICALSRIVYRSYPKHITKYVRLSFALGAASFAFHAYKMAFVKWDYVYNKILCGFMFAMACLTDICLYFMERNKSYSQNILYYVAGLFLAGAIEVCDIPPFFYLFDSHATRHLLMTISSLFYYKFLAGHYSSFHRD